MWNDLNRVAESRFLNKEAFKDFALSDPIKYGLVDEQVSTWHVDKLVEDYRKFRGDEKYFNDRQAAIDAVSKKASVI